MLLIISLKIFKGFYNQYKDNGYINDYCNICYKYLRKQGMLIIPKEMIEEAMKYGEKVVREMLEKNIYAEVIKSKDTEVQKHARNYCVGRYFEQHSLENILNSIKEEHFN